MLVRSMVLGLTWSALALVPMRASDLPAQYLPVYGGSGGTAFTRTCGSGRVMSGIRYRAGLQLDAIGLLCRPVNADGSLGAETTVGTLAGGGGGTSGTSRCPSGKVVSTVTIYHGTWVGGLMLKCSTWNTSTRSWSGLELLNAVGNPLAKIDSENCENLTQPVVAMRGRAAGLVDAIGFICNEP
jgi:hypothetical protein